MEYKIHTISFASLEEVALKLPPGDYFVQVPHKDWMFLYHCLSGQSQWDRVHLNAHIICHRWAALVDGLVKTYDLSITPEAALEKDARFFEGRARPRAGDTAVCWAIVDDDRKAIGPE